MKLFMIMLYLYASMVITCCFILKGDMWSNTMKRQSGINSYGSKDSDMKTNKFGKIKHDDLDSIPSDRRRVSNDNEIVTEISSNQGTDPQREPSDKQIENESNNTSANKQQINKTETFYEVNDPFSDVEYRIYNEIRNFIIPIVVNDIEKDNKSNESDNDKPSTSTTSSAEHNYDNVSSKMDDSNYNYIVEDNNSDKNSHTSNKSNETENDKPSPDTEQNNYEVYETETDVVEPNNNKVFGYISADRTALTRGHGYAIFGRRYAIYVPVHSKSLEDSDVDGDPLISQNNNIIDNIIEKL